MVNAPLPMENDGYGRRARLHEGGDQNAEEEVEPEPVFTNGTEIDMLGIDLHTGLHKIETQKKKTKADQQPASLKKL